MLSGNNDVGHCDDIYCCLLSLFINVESDIDMIISVGDSHNVCLLYNPTVHKKIVRRVTGID